MNDGSGSPGRKPKATVPEIRNTIRDADEPVLSTAELSEEVGITRTALNNRMDDILNDDAIRSKNVSNTRIFWHKNFEGKKVWSQLDSTDTDESANPTIDPKIGVGQIDNIDLPAEGETLKLQRAAINLVYQRILQAGKIQSWDLKQLVWISPFTEAYPSQDGFWNNIISPNLSDLDDIYFEKRENAWYTFERKQKELKRGR